VDNCTIFVPFPAKWLIYGYKRYKERRPEPLQPTPNGADGAVPEVHDVEAWGIVATVGPVQVANLPEETVA